MKNKYMRYLFNIVLAALVTITATSGKIARDGFTLNGNIRGLKDGVIYLVHMKDKASRVTDTVNVVNGQFVYTGSVTEPTRYFLYFRDNTDLTFFVDNTNMTLDADKDSLSGAVLRGSPTQDDYITYFRTVQKPFYTQYTEIYGRKFQASQQGRVKLETQAGSAFDKEFADLSLRDDSATADYLRAHPNSNAAAEIVFDRYVVLAYYDKARQFLDMLGPDARGSIYGQLAGDKINLVDRTTMGRNAPDFTMNDTAGKAVKLSDFRGKYVLIDFWASWCGPCRMENPNVVKAYHRYKDKGFTVLGVSLDRTNGKEAWLKAIRADGLEWTQVSDLAYFDNAAAKLYGVVGIPQNFLISPDGKLIGTNLRGADLENKLASLLH
jgi:peroxiredoxin